MLKHTAVVRPSGWRRKASKERCFMAGHNVFGCYVRKAVKAIFKDGILKEQGVRRHVRKNDRISYDVYSLELVIAVAFRIDSIESRAFREFIMQSVIGKQTSRTKLVCIFTENAMA